MSALDPEDNAVASRFGISAFPNLTTYLIASKAGGGGPSNTFISGARSVRLRGTYGAVGRNSSWSALSPTMTFMGRTMTNFWSKA